MTGAPPTISLDRVSKWYGDVLAVNEVSAEFGPGVTGLLGPNGAGQEQPDQGDHGHAPPEHRDGARLRRSPRSTTRR